MNNKHHLDDHEEGVGDNENKNDNYQHEEIVSTL